MSSIHQFGHDTMVTNTFAYNCFTHCVDSDVWNNHMRILAVLLNITAYQHGQEAHSSMDSQQVVA